MYTDVFGGNTVYPADVSYLALALTGPITFDWPKESAAPPYPLARIIDVMATGGPHTMKLPDATQAGPGEVVLFNNLSISAQCFVVDNAGVALATLNPGEQWELYLASNATAAGVWRVFRFGASTATVQPSALAGYGIVVTGTTLSQSVPVVTFVSTPRNVLATDRASALVWTGAGTGLLNLPGVTAVGNNYFFSARNAGGGMLRLEGLGSEVIDGTLFVDLSPGEGVVLVTDGTQWFTLGRGQAAVFAFDYLVINLAGKPSPYVLGAASTTELNRIAYRFDGALTTNMIVEVPQTVQQYWIDNRTTGAFTLSLRAGPAGVPVAIVQGARGIYYCDGTQFIDADTSSIAVPIAASDGGTGQTSYTTGDLLVATGPTTLAKLNDVAVGNVLNSGGVGVLPFYGKVNVTTSISGVLPVVNGGTGVTTSTGTGSVVLNTAPTFLSGITVDGQTINLAPTGAVNPTFILNAPVGQNSAIIFRRNGVEAGNIVQFGTDIDYIVNTGGNHVFQYGPNGSQVTKFTVHSAGVTVAGTAGVSGALTVTGAATVNGSTLNVNGIFAALTVNSTGSHGAINVSADAAGGSNTASLNMQLNGVTKAQIFWNQANNLTYYENPVMHRFTTAGASKFEITPAGTTVTSGTFSAPGGMGGNLAMGGFALTGAGNIVTANLAATAAQFGTGRIDFNLANGAAAYCYFGGDTTLSTYAVMTTRVSNGCPGFLFRQDSGAFIGQIDGTGAAFPYPSTASAANVNVAGTQNQLRLVTSALRYKTDIMDMDMATAQQLRAVRAVQYKSLCEGDDPDTIHYGFIAEEVEQSGLTPLVFYRFQEDQYETLPDGELAAQDDVIETRTHVNDNGEEVTEEIVLVEGTPAVPQFKTVVKEGEVPRPDGLAYERVVVAQQVLINHLFDRLEAAEARLAAGGL